ncbi:heterogeneous nuclear ribonucleoprotein Q [Silene latifolia]|uniref:heterogeneous nuclear ribonucleoprotein Q n=1 Tax=Silene latifolia TaxID=37657 RepID=UPI003D770A5A
MADNSEIDERVDLDDDNYMEDTDEDVADGIEDEADDGSGDDKAEEQDEEQKSEGSEREQSPKGDQSPISDEHGDGEEKHTAAISDEDKEKHAELLALPPFGSEIFIGGLPKDVTEDDLSDLCEPIGDVFEARLMKNKETGETKGYAFVAFKTKDEAQKAIEELKNKEFKGKILRCSLSDSKHRLFIGNIPKEWTEDQFKDMIHSVGPGAEMIDLKQDALNPGRNRGFAFIEYYNNACADYARLKMSNGDFKLDENTPTVTWADPKSAPDAAAASQVKALYVKNIPDGATPEQLKELFQRHGDVTKVVLPPSKTGQGKGNFGFIYFSERSSALKAIKETEKYEINGQLLEVMMAKPQTDKKVDAAASFGAAATFLPQPAFGFAGNPYGSVGAGYGVAGGFQQPMIYGRGPMPSNMQMVPMVLPDGRIGYVLQQPGMQIASPPPTRPQRNDRSSGSRGRGSGGGGGDDGYRNRRYRPY